MESGRFPDRTRVNSICGGLEFQSVFPPNPQDVQDTETTASNLKESGSTNSCVGPVAGRPLDLERADREPVLLPDLLDHSRQLPERPAVHV